ISPWIDLTRAGPQPRVKGLTRLVASPGDPGQFPTAALADEILLPGAGQVRALISVGGNPVLAWPNQEKTVRALQSLDLLVCLDPLLTASSRLAHYVIAPKLCLERAEATRYDFSFTVPYGHYTDA